MIQVIQEFFAGRGDHAMLLKAGSLPIWSRDPFNKPRARNVLPQMMNTVGEIPHVVEDIAHKDVIGAFPTVESSYLFFAKVD